MKSAWIENFIAGSYAIALHIVLIVLLFIGFGSGSEVVTPVESVDIVQATVMDEQQVMAEIAKNKKRIEEEKAAELARLEAIKQKEAEEKAAKERELERQKQAEIQRQKEVEEAKRQAELEEQRRVELEQQKAAEEARKKAEAEKKRQAELKRIEEEKAEAARKQKQLEEEKRRKAEEAKRKKEEAERKAAEEKKRKEAEKRRQAEEAKRRKEEADRLLQESLAAEEREREERRVSGVVNQHMGMIRQRIKRNWNEPANATKGMQCTLRVSLLPDGDVRSVKVVKSSGNPVFDRSAESAVYKAAPWPQPSDPKAAAALRDFQFIFRPK